MSGTATRSGGFSIGILAVDKASGTINKITRSLASMRAPADRMGQSLNALGDVTGMNKAARGLGGLARAGMSAAKSLGAVGGLTAKIGSVGSIAGVIALEHSFARMGQTLTNNSKMLGMAPSQLAQWQNALNLQSGVSAETTASGLRSMQSTAADAAFGQNGQAATYLQAAMGPNWRTLSQDPRKEYLALSRWFQTFKGPYAQVAMSRVAAAVGMPDEMVPAAMQGPKALQAALDQAQKLGSPSDKQIGDATSLAKSLRAADEAATNLGTTIADKLSGAAKGVTDDITGWTVAANKFIQTKVGDHLDDINKALTSQMADLTMMQGPLGSVVGLLTSTAVQAIANPWTALGLAIADLSGTGPRSFSKLGIALTSIGFGVVANQIVKQAATSAGVSDPTATILGDAAQGATMGAGFGAMFGPVGAGIGAALGGTIGAGIGAYGVHVDAAKAAQARQQAALSYVQSQGLTTVQAAALVGNDMRESGPGLDPNAWDPSHKFYGIGQWGADRRALFKKTMGFDIVGSTVAQQLQFQLKELFNVGDPQTLAAGRALYAAHDMKAASAAMIASERPLNPSADFATNMQNTATLLSRMPDGPQYLPREDEQGNVTSFPVDNEAPRPLGEPLRPASGSDGPGREMHLIIENIHKSDGTVQSRVKSASPGVKTTINTSQPTFNTAMPGGLY